MQISYLSESIVYLWRYKIYRDEWHFEICVTHIPFELFENIFMCILRFILLLLFFLLNYSFLISHQFFNIPFDSTQ